MRTRSSRSNSSDRQIIGVLSALTAAVRRVAAGTPKPQPRPVQPQPKLGRKVLFESLEQRILLSADPVAAVTDGALDVDLTDSDDNVLIEQYDDGDETNGIDIRITIDDELLGEYHGVGSITVDGLDGDDTFEFVDITIGVTVTGGEGGDTLLGPDSSNAWVINDDNTGSLNKRITFSSIENLEGGTSDDTLTGPDANTTWNIGVFGENEDGEEIVVAAQDAGNVNDEISFSSMENLVGGSFIDEFLFGYGADTAATITGLIDGDAGNNILDFSAYQGAIAIDLEAGTYKTDLDPALDTYATTGTFAGTVTDVVGGESIDDLLVGVGADSTWRVTEADSGEIENVAVFTGFENLRGASSFRDTFVIEVDGSLTGTIDGGDGGPDSLMIAKDEGPGYARIDVAVSGEGSVTVFNKTVNYEGLEPIVTGDATQAFINGSSFFDEFILESADAATLRLTSTAADIYDHTGNPVTALTFVNAATVTFLAGSGDDQLAIDNLDAAFSGTIDFQGGEGIDTLIADDVENTWAITALNAGTLNSSLAAFADVEVLIGGSQNDDFVYSNEVDLDGWVDGGSGGIDTLDYRNDSTGVEIELNLGNIGIDNIIGSSGIDTLIANSADNAWTLTGTNAGRVVTTLTSVMALEESTVVDVGSGSITFEYDHTFLDGDIVTYSGDDDSAGLFIATNYYALIVNGKTIKLTTAPATVADLDETAWSAGTRSLTPTGGESLSIDDTVITDGYLDTITFETAHGLADDDQLVYTYDGTGEDDSGLTHNSSYYVVVVDANTIKLLTALPELVQLEAPLDWTSGSRTLTNSQQVGDVTFSEFENLAGGTADDDFVVGAAAGAGVTGFIDGQGGTNTIDYTAAAGPVTVDLGGSGNASTAAGDGIVNFDRVTGSDGAGDTLIGPSENAIWNITGSNSGDVNNVTFSKFENLTGAADNEDGFVLRNGGSLSGAIDGGAGGLDGLAIENPTSLGDLAVVIPATGGAGTLAADAIYPGTSAITFSGFERPFYADTTVAGEATIYGTPFTDTILLSQAGSTVTIAETDPGRQFWDLGAATPGFLASNAFDFTVNLGDTLILALAASDDFTLGDYDPGVRSSLNLEAGTQTFSGTVATHGGDVIVVADTVTVDDGVTITTRKTDLHGKSDGDSGDIRFTADSIIIGAAGGDRVRLLAHDDRADNPDSAGIPAGIDGFTVYFADSGIWVPGAVFENIPTTSSGSGTDMTVDIIVDADGNPEIQVRDRGTGYADDESVFVTLGDLGTLSTTFGSDFLNFVKTSDPVLTFEINGLLNKGGDITLLAFNHQFLQGAFGFESADASIEIRNAELHGRDVVIRADADNRDPAAIFGSGLPEETADRSIWDSIESGSESVLASLAKIRPLVGVGLVGANSSIIIADDSDIIADADVVVSAEADSTVELGVRGVGIAVGYARSEADATLALEDTSSIMAGGAVTFRSMVNDSVEMTATASGIQSLPFQVAVLVTEVYAHSTTTISDNATIDATAGDIRILSTTTKNIDESVTAKAIFSPVVVAVLVSLSDATASTVAGGTLTATAGDVSVAALLNVEKNKAETQAKIGTNFLVKKALGNAKIKEKVEPYNNKLQGKLTSIKGSVGDFIGKNWLGNLIKGDPNAKSPGDTFKDFGFSASVNVNEHSNSATAILSGSANAAGDVKVLADSIDRPEATANASVASGTDPKTLEEKKKDYTGAVAVSIANYENDSTASIDANAVVNAGGTVDVAAKTFLPYEFALAEKVFGVADLVGKLSEVLGSGNFGLTTSWSLASATGEKGGISGSVNILTIDNNTTSRISSGAQINQGVADPGHVNVSAITDNQLVNFVGGITTAGSGGGGSFSGAFLDNVTSATVGNAVRIDADNLDVEARTKLMNITIGVAGGKADAFAISGVVNWVDVGNQTLAQIDDGAIVDADGTIDVDADDELFNLNVGGAVVLGKSAGVGVTGAINVVDRQSRALIGNQKVDLSGGNHGPNTGVNGAANTIDLGYAHGFKNGDQVVYSDGGADAAIGGLVDGNVYYVHVINPTTVALVEDPADAASGINRVDLDPTGTVGDTFNLGHTIDPAAAVIDSANSINLGYAHSFQLGQAVVYRMGTGGTPIGGLEDGHTYYVVPDEVNPDVFQLATTEENAEAENPIVIDLDISTTAPLGTEHGFGVAFDSFFDIDAGDNRIDLGYNHGFTDGTAVIYDDGDGGASLFGFGPSHDTTYYVKVYDDTTVELYEDSDLTTIVDLTVLGALEIGADKHTLRVAIDPTTAVVDTEADKAETIDLGYVHNFTAGQKVFYSRGTSPAINGAESIGGLANKNEYYVIVVNSTTIRLAATPEDALNGDYINLDATVAVGEEHSISVPWRAVPIVDDANNRINFDGTHALYTGQALVYDNGGGTSIGGLEADGTQYFVKVIDASTIELYTDSFLTTIVDLDPTAATGASHELREVESGDGSISSDGKTTIEASSDGLVITATLAAAKTDDKEAKDDEGNTKETSGGQDYGIAVSGSVSVNLLDSSTEASISNGVLTDVGDVTVEATDSTSDIAVSGGFAWSSNENKSVGLAGAVTVNLLEIDTLAYIANSKLTDVGAVNVSASAEGSIIAIAAGFGGSANGVGIAGSVAYNTIDSNTLAYLSTSTVGGSLSSSFSTTASDTNEIITVAGAIAFGGTAGIGAGIAIDTITSSTHAYIVSSDVDVTGAVTVSATNEAEITAVAASIAVAVNNPDSDETAKPRGLALAVGLTINQIDADTTAYIENTSNDGIEAESLTVSASDESKINGISGGVAIGLANGKSTGGDAGAGGFALVFNNIESDVGAYLHNADVNTGAGDVTIDADSIGAIYALAIGGAVAGARGSGSSAALAGAGAFNSNTIRKGVLAEIRGGSEVTANNIDVTADDTSTITADSGGIAFAAAVSSGSGSGASLSIGASLAFNTVEDSFVRANIDDSEIDATNNLTVTATSTGTIDALTFAGAAAVGASSGGGGYAASGAGAYSQNTIENSVEASITNSLPGANPEQNIRAGGLVAVSATDTSTIHAETLGFSIGVGASTGSGTGGALSVGVSLAFNKVDVDVSAFIDNSDVGDSTTGDITISATGSTDITALSVAASIAAGYANSGTAAALSGGGAIAQNVIFNDTNAYAKGSAIATGGKVDITADSTSTIEATVVAASASVAVSPSGNAGAASIGLALAWNYIGDGTADRNEVQAYVENSSIDAGGALTLSATADQDIDVGVGAGSVAASVGNNALGLSGAGVQTTNRIAEQVRAYIDGDDGIAGDGKAGISASSVSLTANDMSKIDADAGAASIAAAISSSGNAGVALSVAVALAENDIDNVVESYIKNADGDGSSTAAGIGVDATSGAIKVEAFEKADIDAVSVAASISVGISGGTAGISVSGAGAAANNQIRTTTNAFVQDSRLDSDGAVDITAENTSEIDATIVAVAGAVGVGSTAGAGIAIGAAVAQNSIGDPGGNRSEVQAYVKDSSINAGGALTQTAKSDRSRSTSEATSTATATSGSRRTASSSMRVTSPPLRPTLPRLRWRHRSAVRQASRFPSALASRAMRSATTSSPTSCAPMVSRIRPMRVTTA
jgi:hypothetical protein